MYSRYEGRVQNYDVGEGGKDKWWEIVSNWARLEPVGKKMNLTLLRSRYLMLTKVGRVNGHLCRFEIFEERFAEVLILVSGLENTGTVYFRVDRHMIAKLLSVADEHLEKFSIQMKEALAIAYIFSDRLQVKPTINQLWWLQNGELSPSSIWDKPLEVSLRMRGGPGRFCGRKMIEFQGIRLVITLYEVSNPSDIQSLRVLIYDTKHCQTLEFRLSEMERMGLFNDSSPIAEQIIDRLRIVYLRQHRISRPVMLMNKSYIPPNPSAYAVEGDMEYDLLTDLELEYARDHADSDDEVSHADPDRVDDVSVHPEFDVLSDDDSQLAREKANERKLHEMGKAEEAARVAENAARPWAWGIYFNRALIEESVGNLSVSIGINLDKEGFEFWVFDNRTLRETYNFVPYDRAIHYFYKKTMLEFRKLLKQIDESSLFDIVDELISVMEVEESEGDDGVGVMVLALFSENADIEPFVLAHVRELSEAELEDSVSTGRRQKIAAKKVDLSKFELSVLAARDLSLVSGIPARNPIARARWNMREIGETTAIRNDCNPEWENGSMPCSTSKDKTLERCILEIEVWDWNFQKARTMDFLGMVRLTGKSLGDFMAAGSNSKPKTLSLPLTRSNKLSDKDNEFVQVSLEKGVIELQRLFLYTSGVLIHVESCIRQLSCPSIISHNITSIAHNHHSDIYFQTYHSSLCREISSSSVSLRKNPTK